MLAVCLSLSSLRL